MIVGADAGTSDVLSRPGRPSSLAREAVGGSHTRQGKAGRLANSRKPAGAGRGLQFAKRKVKSERKLGAFLE